MDNSGIGRELTYIRSVGNAEDFLYTQGDSDVI